MDQPEALLPRHIDRCRQKEIQALICIPYIGVSQEDLERERADTEVE